MGPGWSSLAVRGNLIYTQEQRGDNEIVACYRATTGEVVWQHHDPARFWESNAGAGPRATPTLSGDRVYTLGATGILNALDAQSGAVLWSRNAASDTNAAVPEWGFSSSPLVVEDLVIVDAGGLVAFDITTGDPRWHGPPANVTYSSPHHLIIEGVQQVVLLNAAGVSGVALADGGLLWEHSWSGFGIVQPAVIASGDILISAGAGIGTSRLEVANGLGGWTVEERWRSKQLKAYFSDLVASQVERWSIRKRAAATPRRARSARRAVRGW